MDISYYPDHIMNINPFRYRGYYFDRETGFYFLQSRYYDPEAKRFINADGLVSTGQGVTGYNMFAYCNNNPVNRVDPSGMCTTYYTPGVGNKTEDCHNRHCSTSCKYVPSKGSGSYTPGPSGSQSTNAPLPAGTYTILDGGYYLDRGGNHIGVDLSTWTVLGNTIPIRAVDGGYAIVIPWVKEGDYSDYGNLVIVINGNVSFYYGHMDKITIASGNINRGDIIGYVGSTGKSTGYHLHFEVRINGIHTNPMPYIRYGN